MNTAYEIPALTFTKEDYNKETKTITLNLNNDDLRWLEYEIQDYKRSHRRWIPVINITSPSGTMRTFSFEKISYPADMQYESKGIKLLLTYN